MLPKHSAADAQDPRLLFASACLLEDEGNLPDAATVYDLAYGLDPASVDIAERRRSVLDRLAVTEHGLVFRYIPGGAFVMGTDAGDADERPVHRVWLSSYWLSETPISWEDYCRLMDWEPPPNGSPRDRKARTKGESDATAFAIYNGNKIRLQYCEDRTLHAQDWHAHFPGQQWQQGGQTRTAQEIFGSPQRDAPDSPWQYGAKPMVAVSWQQAHDLGARLSAGQVRYGLPTEAQWEKAARGGLIGARHAWGNAPPTRECCDFGRFAEFAILPMRTFAPNGYGLYAMNGGVWEWVEDWYDRDAYPEPAGNDPRGPAEGNEKVLRGGSWSDCAEVQTVSFRMSRDIRHGHYSPNVGFRLVRQVLEP